MAEDVATQTRRQTSRHQRSVRHSNRSHTRLNKLARPAAVVLNGQAGGEGTDKSSSENLRVKSNDQLSRNWSSGRSGRPAPRARTANGQANAANQEAGADASTNTNEADDASGTASATGVPSPAVRRLSGSRTAGAVNSSGKKSVIQLEHEQSDSDDNSNEFVDTDSEADADAESTSNNRSEVLPQKVVSESLPRPSMPRRTSSGLSIGIHPVEPSAPQISKEQVVSMTSMTEMASALGERRSQSAFVAEGDLMSNALSHSQSTADLARIVGGSGSRIQQKIRLRQQQRPLDYHLPPESLTHEQRRIFECVLREYINAKNLQNPVLSALERSQATNAALLRFSNTAGRGSSKFPLGLDSRKVGALSATTINQVADLSLAEHRDGEHGHITGSTAGSAASLGLSNYLLNKIWTQGWRDPDDRDDAQEEQSASLESNSIRAQALRASSQLHQTQGMGPPPGNASGMQRTSVIQNSAGSSRGPPRSGSSAGLNTVAPGPSKSGQRSRVKPQRNGDDAIKLV